MYIKKIELSNLRNYSSIELDLVKGINVFHGENGSGKTNIIEGVYWLSIGKSFRASDDKEIVKEGCDSCRVYSEAEVNGLDKMFSLEYSADVRKKVIRINNSRIKKMADVIGEIPVVLFSPEDIQIVKGEPVLRRKYIDQMLCQVSREYFETLSKYLKEVSHRNYLLKGIKEKKVSVSNLGVWNEQIKINGAFLIMKRFEAMQELNSLLASKLTSEKNDVSINYLSKNFMSMKFDDVIYEYENHFKTKIDEEIVRGTTLIGPHRDDIEIFYNGKNAKAFASEGQQRVSAILLKLAEGLFIRERKNSYPVVLLDDFSSELDNPNRGFIGRTLQQFKQIIITTTYPENLKELTPARMFHVEHGKVSLV
ncbi:MAG: DNA replication and repair protein RecF [Candidatus Aerophobetes bacterium ADurb.Bin490]|mgnify:FL=1|nr:MAG: DNA replication and repair protein RecF [Candidatus Aerophobetes bacterium ADurb.Bin490]HPI02867.1 DNA replication/repair protein RecF [Candidatus Goldiibacteriota bacterium]HPN64272.1 DNA replication/repair protein RecF [Candidatus Goldiibacteriota bacterium]HRQ43955.1 DNA replication/repair protein RecF [Candidatus Goldiibacteriota bacterium]